MSKSSCGRVVADARVKAASEVVTGIKAIKLYAWEEPYADRINQLRCVDERVCGRETARVCDMTLVMLRCRLRDMLAASLSPVLGTPRLLERLFEVTSFKSRMLCSAEELSWIRKVRLVEVINKVLFNSSPIITTVVRNELFAHSRI